MSHHINLTRIKGVANALTEFKDEIAFVGGAAVSLYVDNPEQTETRPTDDIDVLVEIASYGAYVQLQEKLTTLGFSVDAEAKVTCRFKYDGLTVDIMPTNGEILGLKNDWHRKGFAELETYHLDHSPDIQILPIGYFIASKLEAFNDRGGGDGRTSKDFEDIVFVIDNRQNFWEEMSALTGDLASYIKEEFSKLLSTSHIEEWISGHLEPGTADARCQKIINGMKSVIN